MWHYTVSSAPNGCLQIVCHSKKQVESVHDIFIGKGNYPVDYEEWDTGKDKKIYYNLCCW